MNRSLIASVLLLHRSSYDIAKLPDVCEQVRKTIYDQQIYTLYFIENLIYYFYAQNIL